MEEVYEKSIFDEEQIPVVYAGFWERFGALFLDGLVLAPLSVVNGYNRMSWNSTAIMVITSLVALVYKPLMEYLYGATLGKKALSIVVTNNVYEKPGLKEVLLRNIFGIASGVISFVFSLFIFTNSSLSPVRTLSDYGFLQNQFGYPFFLSGTLGLIYMADIIVFLADKQNRALHDFIGRTYVIKK